MVDAKHVMAKKACACLTSLVLVVGLMPGFAWADGEYPDVNEHVYVGPETQITVDVGNVTVSTDDPSHYYAVFVHAKNDQDATGNVHGSVKLTSNDLSDTSGVVAYAKTGTATANVEGDVAVDVIAKNNTDLAVFAVDAASSMSDTTAILNVGGTVTARITKSEERKALLSAYGVFQKPPGDPKGQHALTQVTVDGDVIAEAVNATAGLGNNVVGVAADANDAGSSSTIVKGGVVAKGGRPKGVLVEAVNSSGQLAADAGATVTVGKGGVTAESAVYGTSATGLEFFNNGNSITMRIGGDVTATTGDGNDAVGISASSEAGEADILVDGTVTAKAAGVLNQVKGGQLEVTVWKVDSDIVAAKWDRERGFYEDEATEAAINYIIKVEQPQEGNVLKLAGTSVKNAVMADGACSFDVAKMNQKVYLNVEEGWTITAAFNGLGEKIALQKDDQGWFIIVPNGGGVYLSAQVAKIAPTPANGDQEASAMVTSKSYTIARISGEPNWDGIASLDIDDAEWGDSFGISAHAKLCHDDQAIYVRMWAEEQDVRATYTPDDPLANCFEDSCLEFFLSPMVGDARYMNFEFNPNCALCNEIGTQKANRERLHPADDVLDVSSVRTDNGWEITYRIPFDYLRQYYPAFSGESGTQMRGNFYKCGNLTANKHYLVWNHVDSDVPNFHAPESFGTLVLG